MIRYYGFLANRVKNTLLPIVYKCLDQKPATSVKLKWAVMLGKVFGIDQLQCLLCKSPMVFGGYTPGFPHK